MTLIDVPNYIPKIWRIMALQENFDLKQKFQEKIDKGIFFRGEKISFSQKEIFDAKIKIDLGEDIIKLVSFRNEFEVSFEYDKKMNRWMLISIVINKVKNNLDKNNKYY